VWKSSVLVTSIREFGNRRVGRITISDVLRRMVRVSTQTAHWMDTGQEWK